MITGGEQAGADGGVKFREEYLCEFSGTDEQLFPDEWIDGLESDEIEPLGL